MRDIHSRILCAGSALTLAAAAASADVVFDWNNQVIDTIRAVGGPPCPISRALAMTHTAIYDAVNSINPTHQPYLAIIPASAGASPSFSRAMPTRALVATRRAMDGAQDLALEAALDAEARVQGELGRAHDYLEGVAAFAERRAPRFTDR